MLYRIIEFSVRNKLIISLFLIGLIGYGSYQLTKLPIDAVPDITNNQVQVIATAPSLGATDIERLVTFPIELANSNIPGIEEIRSFSRFGLSVVTIVFHDDVDVYWARQQVSERLQEVQNEIPKGVVSISLGPVTTGLGEIYQYTIRPKKGYESKFTPMELRTIQDWIVRRQLLGVKGVADVSSFGGLLKQYEIAIEPAKLKSLNITIADVFDALEKNNQNTGGAYIEKGPTVQYIRSEGLIGSIEDMQSILVKVNDKGSPILLRDIAKIKFGTATRYGALCYNDKGEATGAIVMMLKGANSNEVIKNVKERIEQIKKTLPEGVTIEPFLDRTKMVNNAIGTVETNLMEGALIVLFILVLFLGNIRAGFIVASVIPLAMLFAVIMMNIFGVSGNLMSLGALDFGLIIDGAVIIVEAMMHQLTHSKKFSSINRISQNRMDEEVIQSTSRMMNSAVFGQIIILVVYLPIFMLQGIEGKMFKPMVQTVVFALIGAFVLSLTYVPMITSILVSKNISHKKNISDKLMMFVEIRYQKVLKKVLRFPKTVIVIVIGLFMIAVWLLTNLGGEFIPELEEGDFAVESRVLTGSNLKTSISTTQKAAKILLKKFPEVKQVVTKIGSGEIPTDPMPMEAADMMIILKDKSEWTSASTFDELAEKMSKVLEDIPGLSVSFQYPVQMRFNELMTGAKQDVVCKIFGEQLDTLVKYANKLGKIVSTVKGATEIYVEPINGLPQILIQFNRKALAQYGFTVEEINRTINIALAGQSSGFVYEGEKRFELVVRLDHNKRQNIDDVRNLIVSSSKGAQIPLYQLASIDFKEGPNQIQREDAKRRVIVGFNVRGRDVQSIVHELQTIVTKQIDFPSGYYITYGGAFENLNAAKSRLGVTVPISLLSILLLLYFAFGSIKQGLLIYTAIPLSAIGGILALTARQMPFSISAGVGFIALFGVAVLNGIVLIAEFNRLKKEGYTNTFKIAIMGTKIRLRPVLMTAFVASLGFLPMAISHGAGAEVQRPLATVVIGGLLIATFLTLFVLPVLYVLFEKINLKKKKSFQTTLVIIMSIIFSGNTNAQFTISLNAAIDTALKNNGSLKAVELQLLEAKALEKSNLNINQTTFGFEYGHVNSAVNDAKFSISQSFSLPSVYIRQKKLYSAITAHESANLNVNKIDLKHKVTAAYFDMLILYKKQEILLKTDSVFKNFLEKEKLKVILGESNSIDQSSAILQLMQISSLLSELHADMDKMLFLFNYLLQAKEFYTPERNEIKLTHIPLLDSNQLYNTASVKYANESFNIAKNEWQLSKSLFLPQINASYFNQSFIGWQNVNNNNVYFDASKRFSSFNISLDVPVFTRTLKAKTNYFKLVAEQKSIEYEQEFKKQLNAVNQLEHRIEQQSIIVNNYEKTGLPEISKLQFNAQLLLSKGEIDYMQWLILMNQVFEVQNGYLTAVSNLNEIILSYRLITNEFK